MGVVMRKHSKRKRESLVRTTYINEIFQAKLKSKENAKSHGLTVE